MASRALEKRRRGLGLEDDPLRLFAGGGGTGLKEDPVEALKPDEVISGEDTGLGLSSDQDELFNRLFVQGELPGPGGVDPERLREVGGFEGVRDRERFTVPPLRVISEVLETALGRTTGSQRAAASDEGLSGWQKGLLFVSDIIAVGEGRTMPSLQLKQQFKNSLTLQDRQRQETFLKGIETTNKLVDMWSRMPQKDRAFAATQQAARMRETFGEGFGVNLIAMASRETALEGYEAFMKNIDIFNDGASDIFTKYLAYMAGYGGATAGADINKAMLEVGIGTAENPGIFEREATSKAPAMLVAKMPGLLDEFREMGGSFADLASRIQNGEGFTGSELINAHSHIAINSKNRLEPSVLRALAKNTALFAADYPEMVTPEQATEYMELLRKGELSDLTNFIGGPNSARPGHQVALPIGSRAALDFAENGGLLLSNLTGVGGNGIPSGADHLKLLGMFLKESTPYKQITERFNVVKSSFVKGTPASDMSMVFGIMKMFDRTSVVRETEQAQAKAMGALKDKMKLVNQWRKIIGGRGLNSEQRQDMMNVATDIWKEAARSQAALEIRFEKTAIANKYDPRRVMQDLIGKDRISGQDPTATRDQSTKEGGIPTDEDIQEAIEELGISIDENGAVSDGDQIRIGEWLIENNFDMGP